MSVSLRKGLEAIGEHGKTSPRIPSGFAGFPHRMREAIDDMLMHPDPLHWSRGPFEAFADENWSEECQGITFDGERFITSSDGTWVHPKKDGVWSKVPNPAWTFDRSPKALYFFRKGQYNFKDGDIDGVFQLGGDAQDHLGEIDYFEGSIYCALEPAHAGPRCIVVQPTPDGGWWSSSFSVDTTASGQGSGFSWLAMNPWNGYLYSSRFENAHEVYAYDRATGEWTGPARTIHLSDAANYVQGGCFSPRGHLYLACDDTRRVQSGSTKTYPTDDVALVGVREHGSGRPAPDMHLPFGVSAPFKLPSGTRSTFIRCYSAFNGRALGDVPVTTLQSNQELEGICYGALRINGKEARIHVALLENHDLAKDNVFIKPYSSPQPDSI